MVKIYPELLDPGYFRMLVEKVMIFDPEPFTYRKWSRSLSREKFLNFVDRINKSEYWKLTPVPECGSSNTDPNGYCLEVAAPLKYHVVYYSNCDSLPRLTEISLDLMRYSGMNDDWDKWWNKRAQKTQE